jgi:hypothetical protein
MECRQDAVQTCMEADLNGNDLLKQDCDSAATSARQDPDAVRAATLRFCVAQDFPESVAECAPLKIQCQETPGSNECKRALWDYCLDNQWQQDPHPQCGLGLVSYCKDRPRLSETLCRHADDYCREHADETLCK